MFENYLPTKISRVALYLAVPVGGLPFLLPQSLLSDMRLSTETLQWFLRLGASAGILLLLVLAALVSILYDCYHRSADMRGALEEAHKRVNKT